MHDILHPTQNIGDDSFPNAPAGWSKEQGEQAAARMGLTPGEIHWEVVRVLQGCYADEPNPPIRRLCDAMAAVFKPRGGRKMLMKEFPGGPVTQGCAMAGLKPPAGTSSGSFGSVQ
ncbi:MAG TPA: sulfite reductase [Rhizobiales bacterium]|nr:sulfite reductase [Hyphomicrobiales bacterium]